MAAVKLSPRQRAVAHQAASLLLAYPDAALAERLPLLRAAVAGLPPAVRDPLLRAVAHLAATPPDRAGADYVATFDLQRRCAPYLTYFSDGDTRKRGAAMLRFTAAYRRAGAEFAGSGTEELPDHLAVVLEFAATVDQDAGEALLLRHRPAVELLRLALEDCASPYADVLRAVVATLPPLGARDRAAVLRLAAQGPPAEEVGLDGFGPPSAASERAGVTR